jgi:hypothetical protein
MPHSLYLGSGIVQPRLKEYDMQHDNIPAASDDDNDPPKYRPSVAAVRSCMKYSIVELSTSLFVFALFVNRRLPLQHRRRECRSVRHPQTAGQSTRARRGNNLCSCTTALGCFGWHRVYHCRPDDL